MLFKRRILFNLIVVLVFLSSSIIFKNTVFAITSTNYETDPNNTGNSNEDSSSPNYQIDSQVGDVATGTSNSPSYELDHGFFYPDSVVTITFIVAPEKRVQSAPNGDMDPNWDCSDVKLQIRSVGTKTILFETTVGPTDTDGQWTTLIPTVLTSGVYDVAVKGISHLTLLKSSVTLIPGTNLVDMTDDGSGTTVYMLASDVNLTFGDDKVNSLDIATSLSDLNTSVYRTDLNQDDKVNSLDLGIVIANLNLVGQ